MRIEYATEFQFYPYKLQGVFQSASNTFSSPTIQQELATKASVPADSFKFLGSSQIGGVTIIRLKFSGRTKQEVETIADKAARLWSDRLAAQTPPVTAELLGLRSIPTSEDVWASFVEWTWEIRRRIWVLFHT